MGTWRSNILDRNMYVSVTFKMIVLVNLIDNDDKDMLAPLLNGCSIDITQQSL